ncbi:MAG: class I SAM-dependent methyltransferase, partial [Bacteroidetes bacterium]|nr:class I SAM-dependent methyltransferase [Bacteroidota bacterium]
MSIRWKIAQWFELKWWQRYFSGKDKAAYYTWKRQYWQKLLDQIADVLPLGEARTIADLGCGPAGIFTVFPDKKVTAVDPLMDNYEQSLPFFDRKDYPYTTFINQSLEEFEAPKSPEGDLNSQGAFDITFCMNAINHVADIDLAYDRLVAATKDGGHVVVSIDAHNHSFFRWLFRLIPGDILHPHQYNLSEYDLFLTTRSCRIEKTVLIKKEFFFSHYVQVAKKV